MDLEEGLSLVLSPACCVLRTEPEIELKGNSHFQHPTQDSGQHRRHRNEESPCGTRQTTEMRRGLKTDGKKTTSPRHPDVSTSTGQAGTQPVQVHCGRPAHAVTRLFLDFQGSQSSLAWSPVWWLRRSHFLYYYLLFQIKVYLKRILLLLFHLLWPF